MKIQILKLAQAVSRAAKTERSNFQYYYNWKDLMVQFLRFHGVIKLRGYHKFPGGFMAYYATDDGEYGFHDGALWTNADSAQVIGEIGGLIEAKPYLIDTDFFEKMKPILKCFEKKHYVTKMIAGEWVGGWDF